jgi:hypothetical protein
MQYECFQGDRAGVVWRQIALRAVSALSFGECGDERSLAVTKWAIRIIVLNRYLGSEEVFSRGGSVRLPSIVRLAIAEASKPSSRTSMIRRRLVCRAWRVLSSSFLFTYSSSPPEASLLKTPCVVSLWPNSISHAYGTTRKVRATHPFGQIDQ